MCDNLDITLFIEIIQMIEHKLILTEKVIFFIVSVGQLLVNIVLESFNF